MITGKADALSGIVSSRQKAGDVTGARQTAESIKDADTRSRSARDSHRTGRGRGYGRSKTDRRRIKKAEQKASALYEIALEIARSQTRAGNAAGARKPQRA